jgi:hypothetical protein
MTAGDRGVQIEIDVSELGYTIQAGSTCIVYAWPGPPWPPQPPTLTLSPATVSPDGTLIIYSTTGTDITSGGDWNVQGNVQPPGGAKNYTTPVGSFYVNHNGSIGS